MQAALAVSNIRQIVSDYILAYVFSGHCNSTCINMRRSTQAVRLRPSLKYIPRLTFSNVIKFNFLLKNIVIFLSWKVILHWPYTIWIVCFRYFELEDQLGRLDPLANVSLEPPKTVLVTVHYEEKSIVKRFRLNMTANDVKRVLSRELVGQPANTFDLHHGRVPFGSDKMLYMQKTLQGYRLRDDDELFVFMKR